MNFQRKIGFIIQGGDNVLHMIKILSLIISIEVNFRIIFDAYYNNEQFWSNYLKGEIYQDMAILKGFSSYS